MRSTACVVAAILATLIVLSAQAPSRDPAASPACSYLSKEDATAALGEAVTGPKGMSMGGGTSTCEYSGSGIHTVHLNVMVLDAATMAMYKAMCAQKGKDRRAREESGELTIDLHSAIARCPVSRGQRRSQLM